MPRFYFDLYDGTNHAPDVFGEEHADIGEARAHAQAILADLLQEEMPDGEDRTFLCDVRNEAHDVVYRGKLTYHGSMILSDARKD